MFTFDGWVTGVIFELHWALQTRLYASALNSELVFVYLTISSLNVGIFKSLPIS